jgi:hypothetical protein
MKRSKSLIALIGFGLLLASVSPVAAIDAKSNRATLRGLKSLGVLIEHLPPEIEKEGLSRDQLRASVELKLRKAGMRVLTREESFGTAGEPHLYININVNVAKTESDIYPYSIDLLLIQRISLVRDPNITTYGVTWSTGGVGSIGKTIVRELGESVEGMVDVFLKAYLEENPN